MNILKEKSINFAVRIVKLCQYLSNNKNTFIISNQILRAGTAIGALYREAEHAESKKDFIHKLAIAQKECNETFYWIELLYKTNQIDNKQYISINDDCSELMALLVSIIKSTKINMEIENQSTAQSSN